MRVRHDLPRLGLAGLLVLVGCGNDEDVGGGSDSQTTKPTPDPTTTTGDLPTTTDTVTATETDTTPDPTNTTVDPTTTTGDDTTSTTLPPDPLAVDCGEPPGGAVAAEYTHQPSASGGQPDYTWSAKGLPDGLTIDPATGEISGAPATPGDFAFELTVTDEGGAMATAMCSAIVVGDKLSVDIELIPGACIVEGESILDYITGGDGSPIKCATPKGVGDGDVPAGLGVDADSCEITGSISETRYGTWAWIVRASQSGVEVFAPYCATQAQQSPNAYKIVGDHSGGSDNELEPIVSQFKVSEPLRFDGDADPAFAVNRDVCGASCFFGFAYSVSPSPFGTGPCEGDKDKCFGLCPLVADAAEPDGDKQIGCSLLPKNVNPKTGFAHEMWAKGDTPPDDFVSRPIILQWSIDYCISNVQADCAGKAKILENGDNSNLEFAVILHPQG